jgi:hypothetical protein
LLQRLVQLTKNNSTINREQIAAAAAPCFSFNLPVGPKKWSLSKKERLGMMGLSTGLKPNTIKEALFYEV